MKAKAPLNQASASHRPELLIVAPDDPRRAAKLAAHMVDLGVFFAFEDPYRLPRGLPADLSGFKLIVIPREKAVAEEERLRAFAQSGGYANVMEDADWENESSIERIPVRGGLTLDHPGMAGRMEAVPDRQVFEASLRWSMSYTDPRWNDVLRYNLECLVEAFDLTGQGAIIEQAGRLADVALASRPNLPLSCDHVSCAYALLQYMRFAARSEILPTCVKVAEDFLRLAPRYRGVLSNFLRQDEGGLLRAEIAFQACPALARLTRFAREKRYAEVAVEQLLLLDRELRDEKTGLWYLGAGPGGRTPSLWARGCVFSFRGIVDTLEELGPAHPQYSALLNILIRMGAALRQLQDEKGEWHQVLDEPGSRAEGSATAWATAGLAKAIRLGWLGAEFLPCVKRGWLACKRRAWDGRSTRICAATTASMDPDYYRYRPFSSPSYGHFHLLAAIEILRFQGYK